MGLANKPNYIRSKDSIAYINEAKKSKPRENLFNRVLPAILKAGTEVELREKLEKRLALGWKQLSDIKFEPPQPIKNNSEEVMHNRKVCATQPRNKAKQKDGFFYVHLKKPTKQIKQ